MPTKPKNGFFCKIITDKFSIGLIVCVWILFLHFIYCSAQEEPAIKDTEVVIIATQHFISDMPDGYTPGHLRVLLFKVSADILAVEAPVNVSDPWIYAPLDLWQITKPWADKYDVDIKPAGWYEPEYQVQLSDMFQGFQEQKVFWAYQKVEQKFQLLSTQQSYSCEGMNSEPAYRLWRDYHRELHTLYGKDTPWEDWNNKIVKNIIRLCSQNRGKRIAIVFGSAHCYYFNDFLVKQKGIKVIPTDTFFPLSEEEVKSQTYPVDYLKALRLLNFDVGSIPGPTISRLGTFLGKMNEYPELENDYNLFYGKYLLHSNMAEDAILSFEKVACLKEDVVSLFDNQSPIKEIGLVYIAIAKMQMKNYPEARANLEAIIEMRDVTNVTKQWARQLLGVIPK